MVLANGRKEFAISVTHSTEKHGHQKPILKTPDGSFGKGVPTRSTRLKH